MEYEELDLNASYTLEVEVPSRNPKEIDFSKLKWAEPPTFLGFPTSFRFFDADTMNDASGREILGLKRNYSKPYLVAEAVMSFADYKKRELPKLAEMKKSKVSRLSAAFNELGNLNFRKAFQAAFAPKKPVMSWYIQNVEDIIAKGDKLGTTFVALWDNEAATTPTLLKPDVTVLDKKLNQIYPATKPAPAAQFSFSAP